MRATTSDRLRVLLLPGWPNHRRRFLSPNGALPRVTVAVRPSVQAETDTVDGEMCVNAMSN